MVFANTVVSWDLFMPSSFKITLLKIEMEFIQKEQNINQHVSKITKYSDSDNLDNYFKKHFK